MSSTTQSPELGTETRRIPLDFRRAVVLRTEQLTPRMVRVVLGGEGLETFASYGPKDHFKLMLPAEGQAELVLPTVGPEGIAYPEGIARPVTRDYTPRRWDPETHELTVDLLVHGEGPASSWAQQAAAGQVVGIAGPRGSVIVKPGFDWHLVIGDETTLPSIGRWFEELPAGQKAIALIEVEDAGDELPLPSAGDVEVHYVHRAGATGDPELLLVNALREITLPEGNGYVYAGAEAGSLKHVRRYLINERQQPREWLSITGHWKRGIADHDHHAPVDDESDE